MNSEVPMSRRIAVLALAGLLLLFTAACTNKRVNNPLANVGSKQPDKVLFDRAMDALKHNRFDVARMTLQTLINTYPDSEYIARAKLAVADSWYAEGGSTALTQAEIEYKDFKTFFPNMPEAAEAQLKVANIHYQQMEKPDRDFTHAMRAEEEYRNLIQEFPDSKLVPEAKQRLLEVQEVLAEREFRIGRFYYLRESYPAAIARLRSLVDRYPLYSQADEVLYLLGQAYEGEIAMIRSRPIIETAKAKLIEDFTNQAAQAYSRIITRYPVMGRAMDAKQRLEALHRPVPRPTKSAVAQNQKEEESRRETGTFGRLMSSFQKHPDVAQATKVGEPTLVDPKPTSATEVAAEATRALMAGASAAASGSHTATIETTGTGAPPASEAVPHSEALPADNSANTPPADNSATSSSAPELKPNPPAESNELKPNVGDDAGNTLPPPQQVNELAGAPSTGDKDTASSGRQKDDQETVDLSTSKKKKKKGLHKVIPF